MKIKLLIAPGLIVISIILLIWFVYPAYSSPADGEGVREKLEKLKEEKNKMAVIDEKIENAKSLSFDIANDPDKQKALLDFIPETVKEEEIIDNLNYLISSEGLAVSDISVSPPKDAPVAEEAIVTPESSVKNAFAKNDASSIPAPTPVAKPAIKDFETKFTVVGDYAKIKNLTERVTRIGRYGKFAVVDIKPADSAANPDSTGSARNVDPNILQLDMTLGFSFLKKSTLAASIDDPIFSTKKFDMSPIDAAQRVRNIKKPSLEIGQTGKTSPFIP